MRHTENCNRRATVELGPRFKRLIGAAVMPCEMHSVAAGGVVPADTGLAAATTPPVTAPCVCLHRKRTLDTLRQRLARRLKRARRHRHDVADDASIGDDVSDDVDTSAGEQLLI